MSGRPHMVSENSFDAFKSLRIDVEIFPEYLAVGKNKDFTIQPVQIVTELQPVQIVPATELCGASDRSTKNMRPNQFEQSDENVENRQPEENVNDLPAGGTSSNVRCHDGLSSQRNTELIVISDDEESNFSFMSFSSGLEEELNINSETDDEQDEDEGHYGSHNSLFGLQSSITKEEICGLLKKQKKMEKLNVSLQQKFQAVQAENKSREESLIKITTNIIEDLKEVCISLENNLIISEIENDKDSTLEEKLTKIRFCVLKINAEVMRKQKHNQVYSNVVSLDHSMANANNRQDYASNGTQNEIGENILSQSSHKECNCPEDNSYTSSDEMQGECSGVQRKKTTQVQEAELKTMRVLLRRSSEKRWRVSQKHDYESNCTQAETAESILSPSLCEERNCLEDNSHTPSTEPNKKGRMGDQTQGECSDDVQNKKTTQVQKAEHCVSTTCSFVAEVDNLNAVRRSLRKKNCVLDVRCPLSRYKPKITQYSNSNNILKKKYTGGRSKNKRLVHENKSTKKDGDSKRRRNKLSSNSRKENT